MNQLGLDYQLCYLVVFVQQRVNYAIMFKTLWAYLLYNNNEPENGPKTGAYLIKIVITIYYVQLL